MATQNKPEHQTREIPEWERRNYSGAGDLRPDRAPAPVPSPAPAPAQDQQKK